ncbi:MAG: exodeoxyribonuclease V subunit gamma, partial [Clostridia bacterium]|nr:exodeoxyribonuclease V subunit gamma [Clostridia bacterium]
MLYRVFGPAGSGKTQHLYSVLAETFRRGEPCVWITPEPQSFQTEREILKRLGNESSGLVEVMTFGEMPDRVARVYGGASVNYLDRGAVIALLSVLASRHREDLREYAASAEDPGFLTGLLQLFKRLRSAMITPDRLEEAVSGGNWDGRSRLKGKLKDVSVLFRAYDAFFDERTQDARNRLTHLAARLPSCPYFKGKTVFLDGFYRFQEQELAVLKGILSQAKAVWCGFSGEGEEDARTGKERDVFSGIRQTADKLSRLAGETRDVRMPGYVRSLDPALAFLEKNLWADGRDTFEGNADRIRLIRAGNAFDESNAVASGIMELVRNGKRFRDIAVFVRNPQAYAGVLDAVFRASGIPYFFSGKEDIMTNPLIAFVCSSLEMLSTRFSLSSVRKYLKTGYTGLTMDESDLLLRYAESWSIHGSAWTSEKPWTRNPDGYRSGPMTEEQQSTLDAVNEARTFFRCSMTEPLSRLPSWNGEYPADDILETVYRHLEDCGAATHFVDRVNRMLEAKEEENARRESQIWEILVTILDRLHDICGRERMTIARLLTLFRLTAEQYDVSTIPSGADCVTVGDPASMRPDDAKAVFLMGCNEGVFPASCGQDGLFDEGETARLCELDLPVSDPMDARMTAERFYFYSAATTPSETLFLSYPS